jgi:hypothetical protein
MAEKNLDKLTTSPAQREPVRPEGDIGARRFIVVVTEVGERIVHSQEYTSFEDADTGKRHGGYLTTAKREEVKKEIFRGEFTERPRISALANLMEKPST